MVISVSEFIELPIFFLFFSFSLFSVHVYVTNVSNYLVSLHMKFDVLGEVMFKKIDKGLGEKGKEKTPSR